MKNNFFKPLIILASMLFLSACQSQVVQSNSQLQAAEVVPSTWVKLSAQSVALNATIEFPNSQGSQNNKYIIQSLYTSALGKQCLQAVGEATGKLRVLCQVNVNYWQPMPFYSQIKL